MEVFPMLDQALLDLYTDYLLASFSLTTATGLARMLDQQYSHDRITRFLSTETYDQKTYWQQIKPHVRRIEHDAGVVIVDDTIEEKPYTDENALVCWHYDHTKQRNVKGINILNFLYHRVWDDGRESSLPLAYELVTKTEVVIDPKTQKTKRKSAVTKNQLVRDRLQILVTTNQVKFRYVLWDSWFSSQENMLFVKHTVHKEFVGAIKANRTVALSEADKRAGQFVTVASLDLRPQTSRLVYLKGVDFPVLLTKQIFTNKDGSTGVLYLVTSDTALTAAHIIDCYHRRWQVECFHESLKQHVALEKSPTKVERTQRNHIFAVMVAFIKLEQLRFQTTMNHWALKQRLYLQVLKTSFAELQHLKQEHLLGLLPCWAPSP
jgi:hypothetical protein